MAISDVVIIVLVALFALLGLVCGTGKAFISLIGWAGSFVIALFVTRVVAYALIDIPAIQNLVFGTGEGFSLYNFVAPFSVGVPSEGIMGAIFKPLLDPVASIYTGAQMDAVGAAVIAYAIYSAILCLALFFVIRLLMMLITWILKKIILRSGKKPSPVSRLGGFVLNGVKGGLFGIIIFMIASFALVFPFAGIVGTDIDKSFIAKPVFNMIAPFSSQMVGGNETEITAKIQDIMQKNGILDTIEEEDPAQEFSITFDTQGGSAIDPIVAVEGSDVAGPEAPEKDGFDFDGWYYDEDCTQLVEFPFQMPGRDLTLYADWLPVVTPAPARCPDCGELEEECICPEPPAQLTPEQQAVADLLVGENSILYGIGGGDRDYLNSIYFRAGMPVNYLDSIELLFGAVAQNAHLLDEQQIIEMEILLSAGGNVYTALEAYLDAVQAIAENGALEGDEGEEIWVAGEPYETSLYETGTALLDEIFAICDAYGWEYPIE